MDDKLWNLSLKINKLIKNKYFLKLIEFGYYNRK